MDSINDPEAENVSSVAIPFWGVREDRDYFAISNEHGFGLCQRPVSFSYTIRPCRGCQATGRRKPAFRPRLLRGEAFLRDSTLAADCGAPVTEPR